MTPQQFILETFRITRGDSVISDKLYVCIEDIIKFLEERKMDLEKISADTCINKIRAMRVLIPTDEEEHCRKNCSDGYTTQCQRYKPIGKTGMPFRQGVLAMINGYKNSQPKS